MKKLYEILRDGIKDEDWTYCKPEYAPNKGCKVGMPTEVTTDETKKKDVQICYIVTGVFRRGLVQANEGMMFLSDGKFYWYDNLWDEEEEVGTVKSDECYMEPVAWIPYINVPESALSFPIAPFICDAVPIPEMED